MKIEELLNSTNLQDIVLGLLLSDEQGIELPWKNDTLSLNYSNNSGDWNPIIILKNEIYEFTHPGIYRIKEKEKINYYLMSKRFSYPIAYTDNSINI